MAASSSWNQKAALTDAEIENLDKISQFFQTFNKNNQNNAAALKAVNSDRSHENIQEEIKQPQQLQDLVRDLTITMGEHESLALQNLKTIQEMEKHKGLVLASTKDFQQTCLVVLNKQHLLTNVVNEIERHQEFYKNQEVCTQKVNNAQLMESAEDLTNTIIQIQSGIDFFTANHLYRRAELYRQRFVYLRQQALQILHTKILKALREANSQNNLKVNQLTPVQLIDVSKKIFTISRQPQDLKLLLVCLNAKSNIAEYNNLRNQVYAEYFDNRKYLLEQYLDGISYTYSTQVRIHEFLAAFIAKYLDISQQEKDYFIKQFPECDADKFNLFIEQQEYEFLSKRIRPWINKCSVFAELTSAIDVLQSSQHQLTWSGERLFQDFQEKLLVISHARIQRILDTAPNVKSGSIDPAGLAVFPLPYFVEIRDVIWNELHSRLSPDIFQGMLLEIVQLLGRDLEDIFVSGTANLIIGYRHYKYLIDQFIEVESVGQFEIDITKTTDSMQRLLRFETNTTFVSSLMSQMHGIFTFIDDSVPQLKQVQRENLLNKLKQQQQTLANKINANLLQEFQMMTDKEEGATPLTLSDLKLT